MRRFAALFLPLLTLGIGPCDSEVRPDPELKQESSAMHMTGLVREGTNTKPAVPQPVEPAEPAQMDPSCPELLKTISDAAGPCKMEQLATGNDDCTPKTCPECARMVEAETKAKSLGCLPK